MCDLCNALIKRSTEKHVGITLDEVRCGAVKGYYKCNYAIKPLIEICNQKGMSMEDMPMVETIIDFMIETLLEKCGCCSNATMLDHFADLLIDAIKQHNLSTN